MSRLGNVTGRLYRGEVSFDFVGRQKLWYTISGLILVISIAALLIRGLDYSVEFKGGSIYQFSSPKATSSAQVTSVVTKAGAGAVTVQSVKPPGKPQSWQVQTAKLPYGESVKVEDAIARSFSIPLNKISPQFVGPSWGSQISQKALEALIAFMVVIVGYLSIAFEWKMATAALVALLHDIVITIGIYALTGLQVSPATVIGLLTILGYSLYDTVVVFDKVRENTAGLLATRRSTYSQAANLALNQTLVRSINTSLIALLPVAAILAVSTAYLGQGELQDLSLVLFIGMLSGTYSSIFIATPVLADLKEREPQYKQLTRQVALRAAGGRAAARKARASAGVTAAEGQATAAVTDGDVAAADADTAPTEDSSTDDRVPVGRTASGSPAPRTGAGARPGPRQQPRRPSAAKRRPGGKKKRR
ncbi:MAG TPA: protein translocase subunit SecF [Streptosporangiaceae bacterium]|nr:protein translocase subunit SecF [Streptosporangiaceae bacterium]